MGMIRSASVFLFCFLVAYAYLPIELHGLNIRRMQPNVNIITAN